MRWARLPELLALAHSEVVNAPDALFSIMRAAVLGALFVWSIFRSGILIFWFLSSFWLQGKEKPRPARPSLLSVTFSVERDVGFIPLKPNSCEWFIYVCYSSWISTWLRLGVWRWLLNNLRCESEPETDKWTVSGSLRPLMLDWDSLALTCLLTFLTESWDLMSSSRFWCLLNSLQPVRCWWHLLVILHWFDDVFLWYETWSPHF